MASHSATIEFGSLFDTIHCDCGETSTPLLIHDQTDVALVALKLMPHNPLHWDGVTTFGLQRGRRYSTWYPPNSPAYRGTRALS